MRLNYSLIQQVQCLVLLLFAFFLSDYFAGPASAAKSDDSNKDYYRTLGVDKSATDRQIKKAFRKLAIQYHPDKNSDPDAETKFTEIAEDMGGRRGGQGGGGGRGRSLFDDLFGDDEEDGDLFGDPFADFFGHQPKQQHRGGPSLFGYEMPDIGGAFNSMFGGGFETEPPAVRRQMHSFRQESKSNGRCKTVTQRIGNTITTYTQCG